MTQQTRSKQRGRQQLVVAALALTCACLIWLGFAFKWHIVPKRWAAVQDGSVYRSGRLSRFLIRGMLQRHQIDVVLDMARPDAGNADYVAEMAAIDELGLEYHHFTLDGDGTGDIEEYLRALVTLSDARRAGLKVWLHCRSGIMRTGVTVAFHRMLFEGKSGIQAYDEWAAYLWNPQENETLAAYVNENLPHVVQRLIESDCLEDALDPLPVFGPKPSAEASLAF